MASLPQLLVHRFSTEADEESEPEGVGSLASGSRRGSLTYAGARRGSDMGDSRDGDGEEEVR
eukprot:1152284-Pyramimonas_sp.AAC.1